MGGSESKTEAPKAQEVVNENGGFHLCKYSLFLYVILVEVWHAF